MGFSHQEYRSGLPFPPPRDLPNPGIEPTSLVSCMGRQIIYHCATWHPCMHIHYAYKMNKEQKTSLGAECGTYKEVKEGQWLLSATDLQFKRYV